VPARLDITSKEDIEAATHACPDTSLLVNNAGLVRGVAFTTTPTSTTPAPRWIPTTSEPC
jgi:NADP-dependent 3-hydroxy acid dehydrogenase YdfG